MALSYSEKLVCITWYQMISNHEGYFYCLNCFHSYSTKEKLKKHEKVCNDHDYCYVEMPDDSNKISKYNHGEKFMRVPFVIYADLECLLEKNVVVLR